MRLAALDLGSNSFHVLVVDVHPDGSFEPIAKEKVVLRLGETVAALGLIDDEAADRAVAAAVQLKAIADAARADDIVAVGTSALRSATNGDDVAERIANEIDVPVRVLDGIDEARLTFDAVRASVLIDPGPALAIDLGGGSMELVVGDRSGMHWSRSVELGAGRLTGGLVTADPPTEADCRAIRRRVREVLLPLVAEVQSLRPTMLVGSSGTICTLARAVVAEQRGEVPDRVHQVSVRAKHLARLSDELVSMPEADRSRIPGVDSRRARIMPAGSLVVSTAMEVFGFDELVVSEWALREGVILDAIGHLDPTELAGDPRAIRSASVRSLCRRCAFPEAHSAHVARLAVELFDRLRPVHGMGSDDRELLEYAALLHDVGEHVAVDGHERHSAYLVAHGRLRGFAPEEVAMLASVCRFHRRGAPKASFEPFGSLDAETQDRVVRLTALLRVADALDRSHAEPVQGVSVTIGGQDVSLHLAATGDVTVELFGLERKQELFERTFGRRLLVDVTGAPAAARRRGA
jgi:exopolyphosphatase/guanosine-5'-triphosphate,3'-diphosphate pyrophosphatase